MKARNPKTPSEGATPGAGAHPGAGTWAPKVELFSGWIAVERPNPWGMGTDLVEAFRESLYYTDKRGKEHRIAVIYIGGNPWRATIDGVEVDPEAAREAASRLSVYASRRE